MLPGKLSHIGYVVRNLDEAVGPFCKMVGGEVEFFGTGLSNGSRIAFVRVPGLLIELFEPLDKAGLQDAAGPVYDHTAYEVGDLDGMVAMLAAEGIECNPRSPRPSVLGGRTTMFHSAALGGEIQLMGE